MPFSRRSVQLLLSLGLLLAVLWPSLAAARPPWRTRRSDTYLNRLAAVLVTPDEWPAEPTSPPSIDPERFAAALRKLCGSMSPSKAQRYTRILLEVGGEFAVDPFLLAGLMFRSSHCRADREERGAVGLTLLSPSTFRSHFVGRELRYEVQGNAGVEERVIPVPRFGFFGSPLTHSEPNLYFAAALLAMLRDQEATIHAHFPQMPHRHYVSHFVWGDRVKSDREEDRILTDRRRLLQYYGTQPAPAPLARLGLELHSPLDGAPRVVSSGIGDVRDGGARSHRGIDIEAEFGEPVRAVADGRVVYVGVDLPGRRRNAPMRKREVNAYPLRKMGRGGRYVCIAHAPESGPEVRSCYMHLAQVEVEMGKELKGGQRIGTVGRSGMKSSAPHLHFELRTLEALIDPLEYLRGHVLGTPAELDGPEVRAFRKASEALYQPM